MTGWLWYVVGVGTAVLGLAMAYNFIISRRRRFDRRAQERRDTATEQVYREAEKRD